MNHHDRLLLCCHQPQSAFGSVRVQNVSIFWLYTVFILFFVINHPFSTFQYVPLVLGKPQRGVKIVNVTEENDLGFMPKQHRSR